MPILISTEEMIVRFKKVHGDKYDYSKTDYIKSSVKVTVTCRDHGDFLTNVHNHLKGYGCKSCFQAERKKARQHT